MQMHRISSVMPNVPRLGRSVEGEALHPTSSGAAAQTTRAWSAARCTRSAGRLFELFLPSGPAAKWSRVVRIPSAGFDLGSDMMLLMCFQTRAECNGHSP
jgi:hypothetical protein